MSSIRIFCDFDGTIVHQDVGDSFWKRDGGPDAAIAIEGYRAGTVNARECLVRAAASVSGVTAELFHEFVDGFSIDETFPPFLDWCRSINAPVTVLSDGLDLYVDRILASAGLAHLERRVNHAVFAGTDPETMQVSFPYRDESCSECANCKRNHLVTMSADEEVVVYIGDGHSDRCPVHYADIVFARGSLVPYCQAQNITYHTFRSFSEVTLRLQRLLESRSVKQRREAAMARRAVFQQG